LLNLYIYDNQNEGKKFYSEIDNEVGKFFKEKYITGIPLTNYEISSIAAKDVLRLLPFSALFIFFIIYYIFGDFRLCLVSFLNIFAANVFMIGIVTYFFGSLNTVTVMIPLLVTGIGVDNSIHIMSDYIDNNTGSIKSTVKKLFKPFLFSMLTTVAGLMSLLTAELKPINDLGFFTSIGIISAFFISVFLIPDFIEKIVNSSEKLKKHKRIKINAEKIYSHNLIVFTIFLILICIFSTGIFRIKAESKMENYLGKNSVSVKGSNHLNLNYGGDRFVSIYGVSENTDNFYIYTKSMNVETLLKKRGYLKKSIGINSVLRNIYENFYDGNFIPHNSKIIKQILMLSSGNKDFKNYLNIKSGSVRNEILINSDDDNSIKLLNGDFENYKKLFFKKNYDIVPINIQDENIKNEYIKLFKEYGYIIGKEISQNVINIFTDNYSEKVNFFAENTDKKIFEEKKKEFTDFYEISEEDFSYYEDHFLYMNENFFRENFVSEKLKEINSSGLTYDEIKELASYINNTEIAVDGDTYSSDIYITGSPVISSVLNKKIMESQISSVSIAIVVIGIMLFILIKKFVLWISGFLSILVIAFFNFGFIGLFGFKLNSGTVTIASIIVGLSIDYIIHFLSGYIREGGSTVKTFNSVGNAVLFSGLTTFVGFFPLSFGNLGIMSDFGIIASFSIFISVMVTLFLLPVFINFFDRRNKNEK
ncbi:MAG TPA: MMPL family transporter, partial [Tepiditoga sp.]|nr:MMPL family transporter [Tepiditoga sp.]